MSYVPLHAHSDGSLLDGLSKPWQMAARTRQIGAVACAVTDHGSLCQVPDFLKAMSGACKHCGYQSDRHKDGGKGGCALRGVACPGYEKDPLKAILGEEFYLCRQPPTVREKENRPLSHLVVLAKNKAGWKGLVRASTAANRPEHFYYKPRLDLDGLASFAAGNWVAFSGHPGSDLANVCFTNPKAAYAARAYEDAKALAKPWPELKRDVLALAGKYQELFGRGNFFLEIQLIDHENCPAAAVVAKTLRWVSGQTGIPCLATPDAHYPARADAADQRVLLCAAADTTLVEAERRLAVGEDVTLGGFFRSNRYHIPDYEEMVAVGHTGGELANTLGVADLCDAYDIFGKPKLPRFNCPDGLTDIGCVRRMCAEGWKRKVDPACGGRRAEYEARLAKELRVIEEAGLASYFLIVRDYNKYAQDVLGCPKDPGRGSAAGCLVSHLLDITDCDPIKYNLSFERFYNSGRNDVASGRVALPDIDSDFPSDKRDAVLDYIREKYGDAHVAQMATFNELQGREAMTTVLRAHGWGTYDERKRLTAHIPDKAAITDDLQEMMEEEGESSIITWALENNADGLKEYCVLREDGALEGPLARLFEQAIRLEGTKKAQSRHASGVIISPVPLEGEIPMLYDKSSERLVTGFSMQGVEASGQIKMDVLGISFLSKLEASVRIAATGYVEQ